MIRLFAGIFFALLFTVGVICVALMAHVQPPLWSIILAIVVGLVFGAFSK